MEEYKTRMIEEYGDLIKKYYKLKAFLEVEKGQRHLEAMDRSLLREQLHYMGGYLEVLARLIARLFCTPDFESEAAAAIKAYPAPAPKVNLAESDIDTAKKYNNLGKANPNERETKKVQKGDDIMTVSAENFIKWFNQHFN